MIIVIIMIRSCFDSLRLQHFVQVLNSCDGKKGTLYYMLCTPQSLPQAMPRLWSRPCTPQLLPTTLLDTGGLIVQTMLHRPGTSCAGWLAPD